MNRDLYLKMKLKYAVVILVIGAILTLLAIPAVANDCTNIIFEDVELTKLDTDTSTDSCENDSIQSLSMESKINLSDHFNIEAHLPQSIYGKPLSWTYSDPWWQGLWINTAVYAGAFIGTLFVLECLPEDATAWNRAEIQQDPFWKRWYQNIFKKGPEWDHDNAIFNYVLHPYAGAAYFMAARTCGFNFWQSMLYSACISTFGWEFGIEACMERPSYQDLFITPLVGSMIGEGFYRLKRQIVERGYELLGSQFFGHCCAFFLDPVNEMLGWLNPKSCRALGPGCIQSQPHILPTHGLSSTPSIGFSIIATI